MFFSDFFNARRLAAQAEAAAARQTRQRQTEATYQQLLQRERKAYHAYIGEDLFPQDARERLIAAKEARQEFEALYGLGPFDA